MIQYLAESNECIYKLPQIWKNFFFVAVVRKGLKEKDS